MPDERSNEPTLELPLRDLPESTKDFLLAAAAMGKPVVDVIRDELGRRATANGFHPQTTAADETAA